ncbi:MAG TPA: single-stranded-DNA-specific exonuclease RecJ [Treponemataceae bacterium]|nr:single-stranded-DNA-specific exonuclease RecJ [Treponemataceae bacterium]HUH44825.1 single-stranded-DNA-specific exonuclease RecJ [Treponemataceae bacterium]
MAIWKKEAISKEIIKALDTRYSCGPLVSTILARRGITEGEDILYFLEDDLRYQHNPFLFNEMEDAVDRIMDAKAEGEKVLIFGDRDVDGITSTVLLYECLKDLGIDVSYRLPKDDEPYGLNIQAIDDFAENYGSLIITVDCGISNYDEIQYAHEKGISVIITDHHTPPEKLPEDCIIINPKLEGEGYPFEHISGCAVAYKLATALRFAQSDAYKQEICLLHVRPLKDAYQIECIKIQNMCERERLSETIVPGLISISKTRLPEFLQGQQIFVWDEAIEKKLLKDAFGAGIEFNLYDIQNDIASLIPSVKDLSLLRLKQFSKIARYHPEKNTEIDVFFNIFITFMQKLGDSKTKNNNDLGLNKDESDLQLLAISTIADIMPLKNENRLFVKQALKTINEGRIRPGLQELMARQNLLGKKITSTDIAWSITPALNATGRLGSPEISLELLLETEQKKRNEICESIIEINNKRKELGNEAWGYAENAIFKSLDDYHQNIVVIYDERIHRGVTGIIAARVSQLSNRPAFILTSLEDSIIGSVRSNKNLEVMPILNQCSDLFTNFGGHAFAAGFGLEKEKLPELLNRLKTISRNLEISDVEESLAIDAQLQEKHLTQEILKTIDLFEPYGEENPPLLFASDKLKILNADILGKVEPFHLKLTLAVDKTKWPALFWRESKRLKRDFDTGDRINLAYTISRNTFNGMESLQMIVSDIQKL